MQDVSGYLESNITEACRNFIKISKFPRTSFLPSKESLPLSFQHRVIFSGEAVSRCAFGYVDIEEVAWGWIRKALLIKPFKLNI